MIWDKTHIGHYQRGKQWRIWSYGVPFAQTLIVLRGKKITTIYERFTEEEARSIKRF